MVLVRGADHRSSTNITLEPGASLVWQEIAVLGRHAEEGGSVRLRLRVERDGVPLLCSDLALGPAWPFASGPAGAGASRVVGTLLVVGAAAVELPAVDGVRAGAFALADDAVVVMALADTVEPVAVLLRHW
jgi:urease accessory protein